MATTPKRLSIGSISSTVLTSIYTAPPGVNTRLSKLGLTNLGATPAVIDVYHNDGSTDYLQVSLTLAGGRGKERPYWGIQRTIMNAGDQLKIQSTAPISFNFALHGSEIEV